MSEKLLQVKIDYFVEDGKVVLTRDFLLRRGRCCGSGCRNCPYKDEPEETVELKIIDPTE